MWNLLISLAAAAAVTVGIGAFTGFGWAGAIIPGAIVFVATYIVLFRRIMKRLEAVMAVMQREAQSRKLDKAIQTMEGAFVLAPWQFLVASQLHSNIGMLQYFKEDFEAAAPHLEKSFSRHWIARGMLAALRYRRKDVAGARKVFEDAVASNKKEGVLWAAYAWVLDKEGSRDDAMRILGRAVKVNPKDEKLQACLQTLQNGKKLKLGKLYEENWYQFKLEPPPQQLVGPGFRGNRRALYRG